MRSFAVRAGFRFSAKSRKATVPRGIVNCQYIGGPWDGKEEPQPSAYCRDEIGVVGDTGFRKELDGQVAIVKGELGDSLTSLVLFVYHKDARARDDGGATYRFTGERMVDRCAKFLENSGRPCKNWALAGAHLCRDHEKIRGRLTNSA